MHHTHQGRARLLTKVTCYTSHVMLLATQRTGQTSVSVFIALCLAGSAVRAFKNAAFRRIRNCSPQKTDPWLSSAPSINTGRASAPVPSVQLWD